MPLPDGIEAERIEWVVKKVQKALILFHFHENQMLYSLGCLGWIAFHCYVSWIRFFEPKFKSWVSSCHRIHTPELISRLDRPHNPSI
jgi:hypothetical protein